VDYSPLMVESIVDVLVKEERRWRWFLQWIPLQSSFGEGLQPLCFSIFDLRLRPSWNEILGDIYSSFLGQTRGGGVKFDANEGRARDGLYHVTWVPACMVGAQI
jgi:hypothetical protein